MSPNQSPLKAAPKITLDMSDGERRVYLPVCAKATVKPTRWEIWVDGRKRYQADGALEMGADVPVSSGTHKVTVQAIYPSGNVKEVRNITVK